MSPSTTPPASKPLYTRELLYDIEASFANDGEYIEMKTADGKTFKSKNLHRGLGAGNLAHGSKQRRNIVAFQDERNLKRLEAEDKADRFFPVCNASAVFQGATRTEKETRAIFARVTQEFEDSDEAAAITDLIHTHLSGCTVNKIIAFGLGRIGSSALQTFYEHAAARVVRRAVQDVSSAPQIALLVQDPFYTDVCKKVVQEFDFDVIEGFGAKGFSLLDDNTVVLAHNPSFPLREIIADLARPALISMRAQEESADRPTQHRGIPDFRWDVDSVRSRKMLEQYHAVSLPVPCQMAFWGNTWYVRNTEENQSDVAGAG
ncbi:hypothetical protein F4782DRAFT_498663 [Xylaria castorea]|nr:hypothetical protein F4782DRAFT_498663 [Xylaria castorea]